MQYRKVQKKIFPDVIKIWNNTDQNFKNSENLISFKKQLNALIRPNKKATFRIFDPTGLKYLFQLRVGLSPLKCHKFKYNFLDTPHDICECGSAREDLKHFLFHCSLYTQLRVTLINSVSMILLLYPNIIIDDNVKLLLYGNYKLSFAENRQILVSTIKFIKDTKRFLS